MPKRLNLDTKSFLSTTVPTHVNQLKKRVCALVSIGLLLALTTTHTNYTVSVKECFGNYLAIQIGSLLLKETYSNPITQLDTDRSTTINTSDDIIRQEEATTLCNAGKNMIFDLAKLPTNLFIGIETVRHSSVGRFANATLFSTGITLLSRYATNREIQLRTIPLLLAGACVGSVLGYLSQDIFALFDTTRAPDVVENKKNFGTYAGAHLGALISHYYGS